MAKKKDIIRKGVPFRASAVEDYILRGMTSTRSMSRKGVKFYASDASHCPRRAVKFLVTDRDDVITPSSTAYMKIGTSIHEVVTDALFKSGRLIFKEFRLPQSEAPDIRGIVDAIYFGIDDKIMGMEIKSCGNLPGRPKEDHLNQALTYSALTGLDMVIFYFSRKVAGWDQKLMIKSFDVEASEDDMLAILSRICLAYFAHMDDVLPPIPPGFSMDADCRFCGFKDECWEGEEEDLPEAKSKHLNKLYDAAEVRAEELLEGRDKARNGILRHIQRSGTAAVRKKLEESAWS
jgi:hypothetical protein